MGNTVVSSLDKWDCLVQNEPTLGSDPIKVKDMILQQALEEKQRADAAALEAYAQPYDPYKLV